MQITLNEKPYAVEAGVRVIDLIRQKGVEPTRVAIAINGVIAGRSTWHERILREGDVVEMIHVIGGGSDHGSFLDPDALVVADRTFKSRLFLGTGKYPSVDAMQQALAASGTEMVTVSVRYMNLDGDGGAGSPSLQRLDLSRYRLLPNTAGAATVQQALHMARLAREATGTHWIKLEVIGEAATLWPDTAATIEATRLLVGEGFVVLPYTSPDLVAALRLEDAGAATVMPLAAPIGSGQGLVDWAGLRRIIERVQVPVVVDAGIGAPSDAALAMEMGASAVLVNTAVARAKDPVRMAAAMRLGVQAGREAFLAGRIPKRETAEPSSPAEGVPGRVFA